MNRLIAICQFVWPWLERRTLPERLALDERRAKDEARISALDLRVDPGIAVEEARRLADSETERRRGTDQKAATYLPLVAALIPLILTVVGSLWNKKAGSAPVWLDMLMLGLAVAYTAAAGSWAFRELQVTVSHEAGLGDFEKAWGTPHPAPTLARRLLLHTRRNQEGINWKVSCIKMAHAFLLRAFLTFSALLMVNIGWYLVGLLRLAPSGDDDRTLRTPRQAVIAASGIERLAMRVRTVPVWVALDEDCRRRSKGHHASRAIAGEAFMAARPLRMLKPRPGEKGVSRRISLMCGGKTVGLVQSWFLTRGTVPSVDAGLPGADTPTTILAVQQDWPPKNAGASPTSLPTVLLRQSASIEGRNRRSIGLIESAVLPGAVAERP